MAKVTITIEDLPSGDRGLELSVHAKVEPPIDIIEEQGHTAATYLAAEILRYARDLTAKYATDSVDAEVVENKVENMEEPRADNS